MYPVINTSNLQLGEEPEPTVLATWPIKQLHRYSM